MHQLEQQILKNITQNKLIKRNENTILVGVSGGPDSVALLHILLSIKDEIGITLVAANINHGLRPDESEREEEFVRTLCRKLSISYDHAEVNVREQAKKSKKSLEHAARDLRYKALREIAVKHDASLIAVAHTADDQAEEVLIRLLRGSGMKGISGMQHRSGDIIRPMLSCDKETLLVYLKEQNISYCIDSSNTDMRFVRNRVRHRLLPFLEDTFDSGIRSALRKSADSLTEDEKLLDDLTRKALSEVLLSSGSLKDTIPELKLDRKKFSQLPSALQRRTVESILWQLQCKASYTHITTIVDAAVHGKTGAEIHLNRGLRVGVQREYLEFLYPNGFSSWRGSLYTKE